MGKLVLRSRHRVLCGDCTKPEDVARVLDGCKPLLMVTDPPYGVEYDASWRNEAMPDTNPGKSGGSRGQFTNDNRADWTDAWKQFAGDVAYVWHAGSKSPIVAESLTSTGLELRNLIVWAKHELVIGRGHYHHQHEPCWYAVRKGSTAHWIGDRCQTTLWAISKPINSETGHSTQKPLECMARPIRNHDAPEVYDPFLGSGTTLIAAESLSRRCYGIEISPAYVDVVCRRYAAKFPEQAIIRESDGAAWGGIPS